MPLKRCKSNGKQGWKWGDEGKCYTGSDAKSKAKEQGQAIEASKNRKLQKEKKAPKSGN